MPYRVISMWRMGSEVIEFTQLEGRCSGFDWAGYQRRLLQG